MERALQVQASVPTEGSWAWLSDDKGGSRVHWRSKDYMQSGTQVTVTAKLYGVNYGAGLWGQEDLRLHFTVGGRRSSRPMSPATGWSWSATVRWSWTFRPATGWDPTRTGSPATAPTW
ncbi:MAG TPA: Ig-like domain-containing protein [Mycobacterium sp.]|nr:Ig-like domain-containing protein [Mycobacterium sp.]